MSNTDNPCKKKPYFCYETSTVGEILDHWKTLSRQRIHQILIKQKDNPALGSKLLEAKALLTWGARSEIAKDFLIDNCLSTTDPLSGRSNQRICVKCSCGYSWKTSVKTLLETGSCKICSGRKKSKDFLEGKILETISKDNLNYELIGWLDNIYGVSKKIILRCPLHGNFMSEYRNFIEYGIGCTICNPRGFQSRLPAAFYLLEISDDTHSFLGFGITRNISLRLRQHKTSLSKTNLKVVSCKTWDTSGLLAREIENKVAETFPNYPNKIGSFKTEATHFEYYSEVVDLVDRMITNSNSS